MSKHLSVKEAAEVLNVCERTVRNYHRDGRLPFIRVGPKLIRIRAEDLEQFINTGEVEAEPAK